MMNARTVLIVSSRLQHTQQLQTGETLHLCDVPLLVGTLTRPGPEFVIECGRSCRDKKLDSTQDEQLKSGLLLMG